MATSAEFIKFICDQVMGAGDIRYKKMFGEYMMYCDDIPVFLVCDDTVYVKQIPTATDVFTAHGITPDVGIPYDGARPHYILDIENDALSTDMARELARVLPRPKPRRRTVN